jgi:hypothetical protein
LAVTIEPVIAAINNIVNRLEAMWTRTESRTGFVIFVSLISITLVAR